MGIQVRQAGVTKLLVLAFAILAACFAFCSGRAYAADAAETAGNAEGVVVAATNDSSGSVSDDSGSVGADARDTATQIATNDDAQTAEPSETVTELQGDTGSAEDVSGQQMEPAAENPDLAETADDQLSGLGEAAPANDGASDSGSVAADAGADGAVDPEPVVAEPADEAGSQAVEETEAVVTAAAPAAVTGTDQTKPATASPAKTTTTTSTATAKASTATATVAAKPATKATASAAAVKAAPKQVAKTVKEGWYSIRSALGSFFIMNKGSNAATGTSIVIAKGAGYTGQAFKLVKSGSYYRIMAGSGFSSRIVVTSKGVSLGTSNGKESLFKVIANSNGTYTFVNVATGKALAVKGGTAKANASIVAVARKAGNKAQSFYFKTRVGLLNPGIFVMRTSLAGSRSIAPKSGSTATNNMMALVGYSQELYQKWSIQPVAGKMNVYTIESIASGLRLANTSAKTARQLAAANNASQWWKPIGAHGLVFWRNMKTGKMLTANKDSGDSGRVIAVEKASTKQSQRWKMTNVAPVNSGFYEIDSAAKSSLALEIKGSSSSNGANARIATRTGDENQLWFYDQGNGSITNVKSGKALDVAGSSKTSGTNVAQKSPTGKANQKWTFTYLGGGRFKVSSGLGASLALNAASASSGANVSNATYAGKAAQKWRLKQTTSGTTTQVAIQYTLDQMARLQKSNNGYYSSTTLKYLKSVLNPSNGSKYKFVDLRKGTGMSAAQLNNYIATYGSDGKLAGLGAAFVSSCKTYKLNECYLLAHAILESGWGKSELSMGYKYSGGYIDGKYYKKGTYYNFFGIGAYDSSPLSGGRKAAIINGWNSPSKAVTGAAKWISTNYIYRSKYSQPTLYAMKWDYYTTKATGEYGWHQYATSLTWADSIGRLMEKCYSLAGMHAKLSYIKPKYK